MPSTDEIARVLAGLASAQDLASFLVKIGYPSQPNPFADIGLTADSASERLKP